MTNFSFKNFFLHIVSDSKKRKEKNVMKIRIAKEDLVKALKKVIGGIGVGGKDLDYLKITADSTGVEFMTTGRLLGIKTKVSERLEVKEPGECCTKCRRALEIASLMPEGEITIRQKDSALFMEAERCRLKGEVGDLEKVLPFQALEGEEKRLSLNAYTFKQMITDVLFACYRGEENPQMSSVYFEIADSTVQVTALDGHQIAIRKEEVKPTGIHANCMIRGAILSAILPLIPSDIEKEVTFVIGENRFLLETETDKVSGALTGGRFYEYKRLFPDKSPVVKIRVDKAILMDTIGRCAYALMPAMSGNVPQPTIFDIDRTINVHMDGKVTVDEELAADVEGKPLRIGLSPAIMKGILKAYPEDEIEMHFYGKKNVVVYTGDTAKFVQLPVNIRD